MSQAKKNPDCPCTYSPCSRHGNCQACKDYHHRMGQKTACERQKS